MAYRHGLAGGVVTIDAQSKRFCGEYDAYRGIFGQLLELCDNNLFVELRCITVEDLNRLSSLFLRISMRLTLFQPVPTCLQGNVRLLLRVEENDGFGYFLWHRGGLGVLSTPLVE